MKLKQVVLFNICAIASLRWIAPAAHAGSGSLLLFAMAALVFFLPSGIVIGHLCQLFPEDGGLFVWTREAFGPRQAFLCSWFYFISNLFFFPSLVLFAVSTAAYLFGSAGSGIAEKRAYAIPATFVLLWALFVANFLGLRFARWIQTVGALAIAIVPAVLAAFAGIALWHGHSATAFHAMPSWDLESLNLFSLIAFAFVGLELAPILSGVIAEPARTIRRAAVIAGVVCLTFYLVTTGALLVLVKAQEISPVTGLVQVPEISVFVAGVVTFAVAAQLGTWITGNTRLPYVIGLAHYLPSEFAQVHPRWRTPHYSLLFQAVVASVILLMAQMGESVRATYEISLDMLMLATFVPFVYIFSAGWRFGSRVAGVLGLGVTLLAIGLSLIPPEGVWSTAVYELKVLGGFVVVTAAGLAIYRRYERRRNEEVAVMG